MSAFRFQNRTFCFNVLPMGLFLSPAILPGGGTGGGANVVPNTLRVDGVFAWTHLDDILVAADSKTKLHEVLGKLARGLHHFGFYLALDKSILCPMTSVNYCGLTINAAAATFDASTSRMAFFRELLRSSQRFSKRAWGYLAFWLFAIGLSSVARLLLYKTQHGTLEFP